ncbi:MAG: class I SAM-dependent methyltransferase [Candidatus Symbiobacter sp.]|nr:class I SAM-dependent methyltransferase [Candidatus Symbiobacter sp.]
MNQIDSGMVAKMARYDSKTKKQIQAGPQNSAPQNYSMLDFEHIELASLGKSLGGKLDRIQAWLAMQWRIQMEIWAPPGAARAGMAPSAPTRPKPELSWTPNRIEAAEHIWGVGLLGPEPQGLAREWLQPLGLYRGKIMLDFGCGLGAISHEIASHWGCLVRAMESDQALAFEARERFRISDPGQNVTVSSFDPEHLKLMPESYDGALCREQISGSINQAEFLAALQRTLRPRSRCLFLETVLRSDHQANRVSTHLLEGWYQLEANRTPPMRLTDMTNQLVDAGFKLALVEDVTEEYTHQIAAAFSALPMRLRQAEIPPALHPMVMREVERMGAKAKALQSGSLAVYRCYGDKQAA